MSSVPKILIVDDDPTVGSGLKELLRSYNYEIDVVTHGGEAIEYLKMGDVDLVLLDLVMPDIDGFQVMDFLVEHRPDALVIIMTGYSSVDSAIDALKKGAFYYLKKPIDKEELFKTIENALEKRRLMVECDLYKENLKKANEELEMRVDERTKELLAVNEQLKQQVDERHRAEEALRDSKEEYRALYDESKLSEELYRSLLHTSADAIAIYDLEGKAKYINPAFEEIFGWPMKEVEGKRIPFLPESEKEATMAGIKEIMEHGKAIQGFETRRYRKDGRLIDVNISGSRYYDHEGRPAGMLVVLRDTSEKKLLESQLLQAQKMEAIGTLAGGVAHDFNNLLMGIQGRTSLMKTDLDSSHPHMEHLREIEEYVKKATDLTKQLLGFARGGKYEVKPTDINQIIQQSAEMFGRTRKEITIHAKYQEALWTVEIDRNQIEQVLLNLYVNAWQSMPGGGELYLQTENTALEEKQLRPYGIEPGKYVKISITDTGVGMDEKTKKRIFDPFFTTKEMGRGTGLGLASAYGIIKNHGGIIHVMSAKGEGATFDIYLPASEKKAAGEKYQAEETVTGSETILFVDDEDMILHVGKMMMEKLGYKVLVARSGKEALDIYKKSKSEIDLVILDMIMPELGGGETYDLLREFDQDIRVLLSSGYSIDGKAQRIINRGCDGFIQKPFNLEDLSKKLREVLDRE